MRFFNTLGERLKPEALALLEPLLDAVETTDEGRFSRFGNWKGRETGTRPPNIPNPRGRAGAAEPSRAEDDDTCASGETDVAVDTDVIVFTP